MPTISRDGVSLRYLDEGAGPAIVLLHAYPLRGEMFRPQINALKGRFRIIVPDLRGFGGSELGGNTSEMTTLADDVLAILDALRINSAIVGGVSMGGYVAMAVLRQDAGRVRGLLLMDTQATADDEAGKAKREEAARAAERGGMKAIAEAMVPRLLAKDPIPAVRMSVEEMILQNRSEGAAAAQRGMAARLDSKDLLARFAGPALVVVGDQDEITPPAKAEQMAQLLAHHELVVVRGAGHLASLESPSAVNAALTAFLARA